MHVTLLSRGLTVHTTRRLAEAAKALGHKVRAVDPIEIQLGLTHEGPRMFRGKGRLGRTDVVIPRIATSITGYGTALVNQFSISGVAVLNDAVAIANARNKMRLMQMLVHEGIRVPATFHGRGASAKAFPDWGHMVEMVGGFPVAIKLVRSQEMFGVIICESAQSMEAVAETVLSMGHDIIVQQYVSPSLGRDLRALVLGGEVIAAVRRVPRTGRLRHSLSTGARVTKARLTAEQVRIAIASARVVGLNLAAVDMLHLKSGETQVFEVHSSPGLREMETASGKDLARPIVQFAVGMATKTRSARA